MSRWILGILFIANDIAGTASSGKGVAYAAHLIGLGAGLLMGYAYKLVFPLAEDAIYPDEQYLMEKMKTVATPQGRKQLACRILNWNPNNLTAIESFVRASAETKNFTYEVHNQITSYVVLSLKQKRVDQALHLLNQIPLEKPLNPMIDKVNLKNRLKLAASALKRNDAVTAIRLYDSILRKFNDPDLQQQIIQSVEQIYRTVEIDPKVTRGLEVLPQHADLKTRLSA